MKISKILNNTSFGTGGVIITSLCCLGLPLVLALLSLLGLGFVINDFILFPLLAVFSIINLRAVFMNKKSA